MDIKETELVSSFDGASQPVRFYAAKEKNRPLFVALHTWAFDYTQDISSEFFSRCAERDWNCIFPNFRGINDKPDACASEAARSDVLDAVSWAGEKFYVDPRRFFLAGVSGGGFMSLVLAANYPSKWTAVSAWVPISDLARWHHETASLGLHYSDNIINICGGSPGSSKEADEEYKKRSPIYDLWRAHIIPMDINAGIHDGHGGEGSVPIGHSIRAFNELAKASGNKEQIIGDDDVEYIEKMIKLPDALHAGNTIDSEYEREIHFRRVSALARLTIFEGGHEMLYDSAFRWFDKY